MTTLTQSTTSNVEKALSLARLGIPVFRVRLAEDGAKEPWGHKNGHLDATLDPNFIEDWFRDRPQALVGAYVGGANLVVADIDVKNGKDGWDSLDKSWLDVPETWGYDTPSGGRHLVYKAPEGLNLAPSTNYRGMVGVDTRAGSSWVLWNGDVPTSADAFSPAPEWLLDEKTVKSADEFQGDVKDWYDTLEPGEPNALVRRAIERMKPDMGHADMVAATFEAIRLGAEGNPGVPDLLAALEDAWLSRDPGNHSTPEDRWEWKFHEALASGIQKYGDSISLRKDLPPYELSVVPSSVPSHLVAGASGDKETFRALLAALLDATDDDMLVTSILWNSPRTKDLSRDWGLEFVHKRVTEARIKPEPKRENPTLVERAPEPEPEEASDSHEFLTPSEVDRVKGIRTFVSDFVEASATKGFSTTTYDVPAAWTSLSMAFGGKAFIATGDTFGVNLWFQTLGYSGTGKAQPIHSKVLTPAGFKPMGDVQVGDTVVVPSGGTAKVSGVFPQGVRPVYTLTLADGRTVEADEDHLWSVRDGNGKRLTRTTKELLETLHYGANESKRRWFIDTVNPVEMENEWDSIIDPYTLGLLIGDAGLSSGSITYTGTDPELIESLRQALPENLHLHRTTPDGISYRVSSGTVRSNRNTWMEELRRLGLFGEKSAGKHIPDQLLHTSKVDRLALLQGLMDTDGSPAQNGNSADFLSASERLRDDVVWLVRSLGGRATVASKSVQLKTWDEPRTYYRVYAVLPKGMSLFRLPRKAERTNAQGKYDLHSLSIAAIEFKGYEPTQCIMVDHPDHEYVTDGFTRTHNTTASKFLTAVLDTFLREEDEEAGYNLGAISSTQGMQETLLRRDRKPSIVHHDESADLFKGMAGGSEWMGAILDSWSRWYSGHVNASSNIRLKELRGKSAETSFNVHMLGTPDRLLALLDGSMFESGHMARMNWIWGAEPENHDSMYDMGIVEGRKSKVPEAAIDLATDLKVAAKWINPDEPVMMSAGRGVASRLSKAYKQMDKRAKRHERYDTIVQPAITRLCRETLWKCAALLALSRGSSRIELDDVLPAIYYAEDWFWTLLRVAGEVAESPYSRDAEAMERYVREEGGRVSRAKILNQFRGKIVKSQRELDDRLDFLLQSGRLNRVEMPAGQVGYELNGG